VSQPVADPRNLSQYAFIRAEQEPVLSAFLHKADRNVDHVLIGLRDLIPTH
jgi:hypothetical protein